MHLVLRVSFCSVLLMSGAVVFVILFGFSVCRYSETILV